MNARLATQENQRLVRELIEGATGLAKRKDWTIEEAIDYRVSVYLKYAKSNNESVAWEIRGEEAKKQIS